MLYLHCSGLKQIRGGDRQFNNNWHHPFFVLAQNTFHFHYYGFIIYYLVLIHQYLFTLLLSSHERDDYVIFALFWFKTNKGW